ncbi:MAG: hypothetical protein CVV12_00140 [Gammaproteobacteria bacterium HGW-Gammaproteobacteria-2]|nr:MAG: hypothetical protein CVV12_00140 [Gammaproteobacteria bacterium HGW-Gammaproteobacteria-2]
MNAFWVEAASFALRWLHVVAAIAWIGESFYFVMLDRSLQTPKTPEPGVAGESWSVHGGGFYHKRKFMPAPPQLPETLHWSKWKSYTTWLSGFALFALLYLLSPAIYLIDPAVMVLSPTQAVALAFAFPLLAWLVYDGLCRLLGFRDAALGVLVALLVLVLCYAATHVFAGRAAFLLVGAALATIMSANVLFVIIPGQKRMVAALARGEAIDPLPGLRGKQRSVHNTYFTLPVVFAMLSNHYAPAFAHEHGWLMLAGFMIAGALIRQFFVLWHSGGRAWWLLVAGVALLLALFAWLAPRSLASADTNLVAPDIASIHTIVVQRCNACHSEHPSLMASAPKGTMFDHPEQIEQRAELIYQQVAVLQVMPPGNITQLSDAERNMIARWYQGRQGGQND